MDINKDIYLDDHIAVDQLNAYRLGRCTPNEEHNIERHLINCELCQDALDGFEILSQEDLNADLHVLKTKLHSRTKKASTTWKYMGIAASLLLLVVATWVIYPAKDNSLVLESPKEIEKSSEKDSSPMVGEDSTIKTNQQVNHQDKDAATAEKEEVILSKKESVLALNQKLEMEQDSEQLSSSSRADNMKMAEEASYATSEEDMAFGENEESEETPVTLDEVVIVEYNVVTKKDVTGAVVTMSDESRRKNAIRENDQRNEIQRVSKSKKATQSSELAMQDNSADQGDVSFMKATGAVTRSSSELLIVYGTVYSEDKESIPGASVIIKGTSEGTITDIDGNFILEIPKSGVQLIFSFIGYESLEVVATAEKKMDIYLEMDMEALEEVVVIGYGTQNRNSIDEDIVVRPKPKEGYPKLKKAIQEKMMYPTVAVQNQIEGRVNLSFEIDESGTVQSIVVVKGIGFGCDEEAVRLIQLAGSWIAGEVNGSPQMMKVVYAIKFELPK